MQQVLGEDWQRLPPALKRHHQAQDNMDLGYLDIEYPPFMQAYLNLLFRLGALLNRRGKGLVTQVVKTMEGTSQGWRRCIHLPNGRILEFSSHWEAAGDHTIIEYVNPFMGLKMKLRVADGLHYEGVCLILRLGGLKLPLPEWLLGHTSIVEQALNHQYFHMDFQLQHPWLGRLYRYRGDFRSVPVPDKTRSRRHSPEQYRT
ncbi:DUF4166 domain-containing protein [Thiolapillus brandeum]|uniref:DUF4166 domain-containing protein n=1 Tax=Thiolapillus brandeum TaxID=1076588 RepID=A0A7U6JGQ0_9GAMM|nr:DUF4166 domain-containing protein [Thiolapillus brandeum]BAO43641.1 conserved hypothetical protein [Thiolapillus brandeum]